MLVIFFDGSSLNENDVAFLPMVFSVHFLLHFFPLYVLYRIFCDFGFFVLIFHVAVNLLPFLAIERPVLCAVTFFAILPPYIAPIRTCLRSSRANRCAYCSGLSSDVAFSVTLNVLP